MVGTKDIFCATSLYKLFSYILVDCKQLKVQGVKLGKKKKRETFFVFLFFCFCK
jgi:hypothetical protein